MAYAPKFPSVEYERAVKRLESIGVIKPGATRRTAEKYIAQFAEVLKNPGKFLYRKVDSEMGETLSKGGSIFPNPRVYKVAGKNHVFFPAPEGGHIRQTKNTISVVTNRGTTRYTRGAYSSDFSIPRNIEKFVKPGKGDLFLRGDKVHSGDHFFTTREEGEELLEEFAREDETASMNAVGLTPAQRSAKRESYSEWQKKWQSSLLFAVHFPAPKNMRMDYEKALKARESRKNNPPAWK